MSYAAGVNDGQVRELMRAQGSMYRKGFGRTCCSSVVLLFGASGCFDGTSGAESEPARTSVARSASTEALVGAVPLFDGATLDGWSVNRGEGEGLTAEQIFTVDDLGIHVYAGATQGTEQPIATLMTDKEYSHYVLEFEYKWGSNRFGERSDSARDAGVLYHVHSDVTTVWPPSLEMQMGTSELGGRWVTGDAFILGGITQAVVGGEVANSGQYRTNTLAEHPEGEWNQLRLRVDADTSATYELNGVELNYIETFKKKVGDSYVVLDRGRIAIQAEYAELWYRNIRIKEL